MPIEHALWKVGEKPKPLEETSLTSEAELEDMIARDVSILDKRWLLLGRQVPTAYNKSIDLLAIDSSGSIIIIELKRNRTPREVVAQAIDYATWVKDLESGDVADIFERHKHRLGYDDKSIDQAFLDKFGVKLEDADVNSSHQMVVVASELDSSTERIVRYLSDYKVAINAVYFRVFEDGDNRYLSRAWFIDPSETLERATTPTGSEPWNGEYYVSFGHDASRSWKDARKYGFISAGGGKWYVRTLNMLSTGDRIWVNVPGTGYVGVGTVKAPVVKADEFVIDTDYGEIPFLSAELNGDYLKDLVDNEDNAEYLVGVDWIRAVPLDQAKSEVGFFGNQNTVARPTSPKWRHTVERLKLLFDIK